MKYSALLFLISNLIYSSSILEGQERAAFKARSMLYILQADKLDRSREIAVKKLATCGRDLIVIDYAYTTTQDGIWTTKEIDRIRQGKLGRKVVAYISIGEAENYRPYWQNEWDANKDGQPDKGAPSFLNSLNPDWEGNYKVRYWHSDWQNLILKYIDQINQQGFDGIYLDIVDAFEFYEYDSKNDRWIDNRKNPETGNTYRLDMVAWIKKIAEHARKTSPTFLIIPQNAPQLLVEPGYTQLIDAIAIEDLFTINNEQQKLNHINFVIGFLKNIQRVNKPVFLIEYGTQKKARDYSVKQAKDNNLHLLLTNRALSIPGIAESED